MGRIIGAIVGVIAIIVVVVLAYAYVLRPVGHWAGNALASHPVQQTNNGTSYTSTTTTAPATTTTSTTAGTVSTSTASTMSSTSDNSTCSNQGVRNDNDPAVHPEGWTFDKDHAYVVHVWSNFRSQNLNPQNFPKPGENTPQHEFILFIDYGQGATLPPGTGGSSWAFDCHNQGWADYNMEKVTEHFVDISIDQIQSYYNTGNPWGTAATQPAPQPTAVASTNVQTCSADSIGDPIDHPAVKDQKWTLPGNMAYVVHVWSNQWPTNLNPQNFDIQSKQSEFIYVTGLGPDVVFPVGTGGKAYPYACNESAQADYVNQMKTDGFVPITWEQLVHYSQTGTLN
jgi:hypothetical protein